MRFRACNTLVLLLLACVTAEPGVRGPEPQGQRLSNLRRAAALPWKDEGQCMVQEAAQAWPVVVERCFHTLDTHRIRFRDTQRRCPIALADGPDVETMVGLCLLTQPEIVVGAVVVIGLVVVAVAITEELDAAERRERYSEDEATRKATKPVLEIKPASPKAVTEEDPMLEVASSGAAGSPPKPPVSSREGRPECTPLKIPPRGGNTFHNQCADGIPSNGYKGHNVFVNGKAYDAMDIATDTLWEVKTNAIETYNPFVQETELQKQVTEGRRERDLAAACGYKFVIGVRTQMHQKMLTDLEPLLDVVLMPWC